MESGETTVQRERVCRVESGETSVQRESVCSTTKCCLFKPVYRERAFARQPNVVCLNQCTERERLLDNQMLSV